MLPYLKFQFGNILPEAFLPLYLVVVLVIFGGTVAPLSAQNRHLTDSLEFIYTTQSYPKGEELQILQELAFNHPNPDRSLHYSQKLLNLARASDSVGYIIAALQQQGNALRLKGDIIKALQSYFQGVDIAIRKKRNRDLGLLYSTIADVYSVMENRKNTVLYYKKAIAILKDENDSLNYASTLANLGDEYNLNFSKPDSALLLFEQSGAIFKALNNPSGLAYNLGNVGLAYAQKGNFVQAENNISKAIEKLSELGDFYPICVYLTYMSDIYANKKDYTSAFHYAERSLALAEQYGLKDQIGDANLKLSELYDIMDNPAESLAHYKEYVSYKDSVRNIASVQQMANLRTDFEIAQKQVEVDLLNQEKKTQQVIAIAMTVGLAMIALLAFGLYRRYRFIRSTKMIIEKEKERSEKLLLNILPEETAVELKANGKVKAKRFESVTILFTDFKGFTAFAENLSPEQLVESVDYYFSKFDEIMEKHGLEKIKTVGDAYMCAGGLPFILNDHAVKMVRAAFEIVDFVEHSKRINSQELTNFDIRVGINSGPVVAGVVGTKKFAYDIWGDSVNVASRMESSSEPGRINISADTYELVKHEFKCTHRGEIYVRNKGMMKMYFVEHPDTYEVSKRNSDKKVG
ncbi:adenylate/guanylate cyclase domain-containing protein [Pareuzebyella sediminis]|uniref:adenylate/guanylate cyclase domain-containing protein n=1 Tax=Pareuzebyella sediminis TaxID=2607998 RepID=UPI0011EC09C2|nr:adenylate/guanylate cyclase domain-containing protein [Pareuzebyella sediminis]